MDIVKNILSSMENQDSAFIDDARQAAKKIKVHQSAWCKKHGYSSEKEYKKKVAEDGIITYHIHFCFPDNAKMIEQLDKMKGMLDEKNLKLDRFGVSLDSSMAFPPEMRKDGVSHKGIYLNEQADWNELASFDFSQPHLGDDMIGSPASYDSCCKALTAGITTMGNMSQFFRWDYPDFIDVEKRTQNTLMAIAVMSEHVANGAIIHSNLDDGYGDNTTDMGELIAMALFEKYIVEDLMGAQIAHSFGDMLHSPYKRLLLLSALKKIHSDEVFGSMVFSNKLGREKKELSWNDVHLCMCMLYDMAAQVHYKTGHAVTVMADRGLDDQVTNEELVRKLAMAKQLEAYMPEVLKTINFKRVDNTAYKLVVRGKEIMKSGLMLMDEYIDIKNPYMVTLAIKKIGVEMFLKAAEEGLPTRERISTDIGLWER